MEGDLEYMRLALAEADHCIPTPTAFCVGCILVTRWPSFDKPVILTRGYSRELPGNTHAEANALSKARDLSSTDIAALFPHVNPPPAIDEILALTDVYTTLEPCSVRTSGLAPCADAVIAAHCRRCVIGVGEPPDFVNCEGARRVKQAGVQVDWVGGLEEECLVAARRGH
jgi:pyrimidine deaminase RibD-like protein